MTLDRRLVAVSFACAAGLLTFGLVESSFAENAEPPDSVAPDDGDRPSETRTTPRQSSSPARQAGRPPDWSGESTEDFHRHCPGLDKPIARRGVRGGFTARCEARLDQRFLDEVPLLTPLTAENKTLTWRHVFHDPLGKRRTVLDTLADPVCQAAVDGEIRYELSERCHADAIADYAVLKYKCASGLYRIGRRVASGIDYPPLFNIRERLFNKGEYWRKRWGVENAYFRHAWIAAKCAGVPEAALASLGVFHNAMAFGGKPAPGEEHWWWVEQGFEAYRLMGIADRLASHLSRTEYGYEPAAISVWQRVQPVMAEVLKVKDPGPYPTSTDSKMARLKHAVATTTWGLIRRIEIDDTWLAGQVGEYTKEELEQAAEAARTMMARQNASSYRH